MKLRQICEWGWEVRPRLFPHNGDQWLGIRPPFKKGEVGSVVYCSMCRAAEIRWCEDFNRERDRQMKLWQQSR